jgi:hypothetical protein
MAKNMTRYAPIPTRIPIRPRNKYQTAHENMIPTECRSADLKQPEALSSPGSCCISGLVCIPVGLFLASPGGENGIPRYSD